jgi:pilus assembly protein CpaF
MHVQIFIQPNDAAPWTETVEVAGAFVIGRHASCAVRLESDLVSRQHVRVEVMPGGIRVEDLSSNGTLVGQVLLRRETIDCAFGTPIVLGDFTVSVVPVVAALPSGGVAASRPVASAGNSVVHHERARSVPAATSSAPTRGSGSPAGPSLQPSALAPQYHSPPSMHPARDAGASRPSGSNGLRGAVSVYPVSGASMTPAVIIDAPALPVEKAQRLPVKGITEADRKQADLRREIHKALLEQLDLATMDTKKLDDPSLRPKVLAALRTIIGRWDARIPAELSRDGLIGELADEALGLGPLERFLADPSISEIMVVDPSTIYIEQNGKIVLSSARFTDDERVRAVIERIVTPLGRRIDESSPLVDARLKDGSRVNAIIKPIALRGSCITIRKFAKKPLELDDLVRFGALTAQMGLFLTRSVLAKKNMVISGGTGSGKTTTLNILSGAIPEDDRIVTIEDAAELQLRQPHVVSLETRPANLEGRGEYTIRDLVKNALRMRPDRIVVGECRGGEALDMLQAMNTGHDGSLTTTHANSPREALSRLETLVLMAGLELPVRAIREQIASSVHLIIQQSRLSDGSRKIMAISEVSGLDADTGSISLRPIFEFVRTGTGEKNKVLGEHRATGYLPSYLNDFIVMGLIRKGEPYL